MELYLFSKFICYDLSKAVNHLKADHAYFCSIFFFLYCNCDTFFYTVMLHL